MTTQPTRTIPPGLTAPPSTTLVRRPTYAGPEQADNAPTEDPPPAYRTANQYALELLTWRIADLDALIIAASVGIKRQSKRRKRLRAQVKQLQSLKSPELAARQAETTKMENMVRLSNLEKAMLVTEMRNLRLEAKELMKKIKEEKAAEELGEAPEVEEEAGSAVDGGSE
jgi:hypothetical protein